MKTFLCLLACFVLALAAPAQEEVKPYAHTNSKGVTYYLFTKQVKLKDGKERPIYYFAKDPKNKKGTPLAKVPEAYQVSETKNGLLVLKKKKQ